MAKIYLKFKADIKVNFDENPASLHVIYEVLSFKLN